MFLEIRLCLLYAFTQHLNNSIIISNPQKSENFYTDFLIGRRYPLKNFLSINLIDTKYII